MNKNCIKKLLQSAYSKEYLSKINCKSFSSTHPPIGNEMISENFVPFTTMEEFYKYIKGNTKFTAYAQVGTIFLVGGIYLYHQIINSSDVKFLSYIAFALFVYILPPIMEVLAQINQTTTYSDNEQIIKCQKYITDNDTLLKNIFKTLDLDFINIIYLFQETNFEKTINKYITISNNISSKKALDWMRYILYDSKLKYFKRYKVPISQSSYDHLKYLEQNYKID